jgi:hypothetical protein
MSRQRLTVSDRLREALRHGLDSVRTPSGEIVSRAKARRHRRRSRALGAAAIGLPILLAGSVVLSNNYSHGNNQALTTASSSPTSEPATPTPGASAPSSGSASPTSTAHAVAPSPSASKPPRCDSTNTDIYTTTDKSSYAPGDKVRVGLVLRNRSTSACGIYCSDPHLDIEDSNGTTYYWRVNSGKPWNFPDDCANPQYTPPTAVLQHGQTYSDLSAEWDQVWCDASNSCGGTPVPPGTYFVGGYDFWFAKGIGAASAVRATFTIGPAVTASPPPSPGPSPAPSPSLST